MILRYATVSLVALLLAVCWQTAWAGEADPGDTNNFVDSVVKKLSMAPFSIPQLKSASFATLENRSGPNDSKLSLCWLKDDKGRVGYVLVWEGDGGGREVIAASATTRNVDNILSFVTDQPSKKRRVNFSKTSLFSFMTSIPLIATAQAKLGGNRVDVSSTSCCVVSFLHFLQYVKGIPLFGHNRSTCKR